MRYLAILFIFLSLFSCTKKQEEDTSEKTYIFDPATPGGGLTSNGRILGVYNVKLDLTTEPGSAILSWTIPSIYLTQKYNVVLFKVNADSSVAETLSIDDPSVDIHAFNYEITRTTSQSYTDSDVIPGETYGYWIFLNLNGSSSTAMPTGLWSEPATVLVSINDNGGEITIPSAQDFWDRVRFSSFVFNPDDTNGITRETFQSIQSTAKITNGRFVVANGGSRGYAIDSSNNRILMLENSILKVCEDYKDDELVYLGCRIEGLSRPMSVINVIGQQKNNYNYTCSEYNDICSALNTSNCSNNNFCQVNTANNSCEVKGSMCLTNPTDLLLHDGKLIISDSGNDRVVSLDIPTYGCDPTSIPGKTTPIDCQFTKVYGKKSLNDFEAYDIEFSGKSMLSLPGPLLVDDETQTLFIGDKGNSRIVGVRGWNNSSNYDCSENNWQTNLCSFSFLLGQKDYTSKVTFNDLYEANPTILGGTFDNKLITEPDLLKRYMKNPSKMLIKEYNGVKELIIASDEDFEATAGIGTKVALKGRILKFPYEYVTPNSSCNSVTFLNGGCDATSVIGQKSFDELIVLSGASGGTGNYSNSPFGLSSIGDMLISGATMMVTDYITNSVYVWEDINNIEREGGGYSYKVLNPENEFVPDGGYNKPDLKGITGISFDDLTGQLYISDPVGSKIYQLNLFTSGEVE